MLLGPLTDALVLVRDRIKNFEREFTNNEQQTRLSLVDPVLKALAWDPQDPSFVKVEYTVRQRNRSAKVDYALLDSKQDPIALVEAKKLGTDLSDAHLQLFEYAVGKTVPYLIATNGADWAVYKWTQHSDGMGLSKLLAVSITGSASTLKTIKLLSLWRGLLTSQSSIDRVAPALNALETHPLESKTAKVSDVRTTRGGREGRTEPKHGAREQPLQDNDDEPSTKTFTLNNPPNVLGSRPVELTLPDGTKQQVRSWSGKQSSVFVEIVRWLSDTDQINVALPWNEQNSTYKRAVLDKKLLLDKNGAEKWQVEIESDLFLLVDHDAKGCCYVADKLLTDCGINSAEVKVTLASPNQ